MPVERLSVHRVAGRAFWTWVACFALLFVAAWPRSALSYEMTWSTIDCGGGTCRGGPYVLHGTIGQPDAGYCHNDRYDLVGGFWPTGLDVRALFASVVADPLTSLSGPSLLPLACVRAMLLSPAWQRFAGRPARGRVLGVLPAGR